MDNCKFTFDGTKWNAGNEIYWFDATTKADFYCYYPYTPRSRMSMNMPSRLGRIRAPRP